MLDYRHLSETGNNYDKDEVLKNLIRSKKSKKERVIQDAKLAIFKALGGIVVKNIENFFLLVKNYDDVLHTRDELVSEAFLILNNCIEKFEIKKGTAFFWYYNKSLTWGMQRIIEKQYYRHRNTRRVDGNSYKNQGVTEHSTDFLDFYFEKFGITEEEQRLIESKMSREKIKDFIENNDDMTWNKYFRNLTSVKEKLKPLKDEDYDN